MHLEISETDEEARNNSMRDSADKVARIVMEEV